MLHIAGIFLAIGEINMECGGFSSHHSHSWPVKPQVGIVDTRALPAVFQYPVEIQSMLPYRVEISHKVFRSRFVFRCKDFAVLDEGCNIAVVSFEALK